MRVFSVDGLRVRVDDESGVFTFGNRWYCVVLGSFVLLGLGSPFLGVPVACLVAELRGQVTGGEGLVGLQRIAWWGFGVFLWCMFAFMFLGGLLLLRMVYGYLVYGTRRHVLDRWAGRFRIGRSDRCGLDQISAVVLSIERNSEEGEDRFYLWFRLKDGPDLPLRHLGHFGFKDENTGRFVAELAGFLGVPIVKVPPDGTRDPFIAELTELLGDLARFLHLPLRTARPAGAYGKSFDVEDW
jgi:hypothetical protein